MIDPDGLRLLGADDVPLCAPLCLLLVAVPPHSVLFWLQVHDQAVLLLQQRLAELQRGHDALKMAAAEAGAVAEMAAPKQATGDRQLGLGDLETTASVPESHERFQQVCLRLHCQPYKRAPSKRECSHYTCSVVAPLARNRVGLSASIMRHEEGMKRGQAILLPAFRCAEGRIIT